MSNYPDHFKKLFKNIIPINDYLVATFNMNLEHVNSPIDRDMLKNKILNRIVIGLPYSIVEYSKEESSKDNTNDRQCNTMAEIIDQVRREILLVGKGNDHMLTSGVYLSLDRDQYNERIIRENITNSVTKELLSPEWDTFLRWTGENIIRHLFKHTVLLVRIQNDNFYQLSGPRVNVVMDHTSNIDTQQTDSTKTITYTLIPGKMLYNKRFLRKPQVLMKNNTLEQLKVMFPREFSKKRKKFPKRLDAIKPIVEQTITANARSKPLSALAHTCISPKDGPIDKMTTSPNAVYQFVVRQTRKVFPMEFWGSKDNLNEILKTVKRVLNLRKREKLDLPNAIQDFNIFECEWLAPPRNSKAPFHTDELRKRKDLLYQAIDWYINTYVFSLIRAHFYVTEAGTSDNKIIFIHADIWQNKSKPFIKELISKRYKKIPDYKPDGGFVASMRFIPKGDEMRPITNMSGINKGMRVKLERALKILDFERRRHQSENVGQSITNLNELWETMIHYKKNIFQANKSKQFHFVKTDIQNCFDSIDLNVLLEILKSTLQEKYDVRSYITTYSQSGEINWTSKLFPETKETQCSSETNIQQLAERFTKAIWLESGSFNIQEGQALLQLIEDHIKNNVIKIGNDYYQQKIGIPQGSCLSTTLCDFFYSHMEKECLSSIKEDPDAVLLRYVDDFLLITSDLDTIDNFCQFIVKGVDKYGTSFNAKKSFTTAKDLSINLWTENEISWCGLKIDTTTLDIASDYSRYIKTDIRNLLTLDFTKFYIVIEHKLLQSINTKQIPILVDLNFNSENTVYRNLYESYLLGALKFGAYVKALALHDNHNKKFQGVISYKIILRVYQETVSNLPECLDRTVLRALYYYAFIQVLSRKQALFQDLLQKLKRGFEKQDISSPIKRMIKQWPRCSLVGMRF